MPVLAVGLLTFDLLQVVEAVPGPNQKVACREAAMDFGGPAANAAATISALGTRASLATVSGTGPLGEALRGMVAATGVRLRELDAGARQAPVSSVLITAATGERAVVSSHAALAGGVSLTGDLGDATVLLLDGHYLDAALEAARLARSLGVPVILDGGSWKDGLEELMELVDIAILSEDFDGPTGGCRFVARSHGAGPIDFSGRQIPVPRVDVVDTLGAGDVLHGAFCHYADGQRLTEQTVADCLEAAARIASLSCGHPGAKGWLVPAS